MGCSWPEACSLLCLIQLHPQFISLEQPPGISWLDLATGKQATSSQLLCLFPVATSSSQPGASRGFPRNYKVFFLETLAKLPAVLTFPSLCFIAALGLLLLTLPTT